MAKRKVKKEGATAPSRDLSDLDRASLDAGVAALDEVLGSLSRGRSIGSLEGHEKRRIVQEALTGWVLKQAEHALLGNDESVELIGTDTVAGAERKLNLIERLKALTMKLTKQERWEAAQVKLKDLVPILQRLGLIHLTEHATKEQMIDLIVSVSELHQDGIKQTHADYLKNQPGFEPDDDEIPF